MKSQLEISEFLIIGFITSFTILQIILLLNCISPESTFEYFKSLTNSEIVIYTLILYVIGLVTHRVLRLVNFKRIIKWRIKNILFSKKDIDLIGSFNLSDWNTKQIIVCQLGSDAIISKIINQESIMRIFKSITLILPFTAIINLIWIGKYYNFITAITCFTAFLLLSFLSYKAHSLSKQTHINFIEQTYFLLRELENKETL